MLRIIFQSRLWFISLTDPGLENIKQECGTFANCLDIATANEREVIETKENVINSISELKHILPLDKLLHGLK